MKLLAENSHLAIPLSSNHDVATPLRYPGGKTILWGFFKNIIGQSFNNSGSNAVFVEPYAGGAGVATSLLLSGSVSKVVINDWDSNVYAFWNSVVNHTDSFLELFDTAQLTIDEWRNQKRILRELSNEIERGFAFFFLNRTNRSGIINAGVIGGLSQAGKFKIDARYNALALRKKIVNLGSKSSSITVTNRDGKEIVENYAPKRNALIFADPPYVKKARVCI